MIDELGFHNGTAAYLKAEHCIGKVVEAPAEASAKSCCCYIVRIGKPEDSKNQKIEYVVELKSFRVERFRDSGCEALALQEVPCSRALLRPSTKKI